MNKNNRDSKKINHKNNEITKEKLIRYAKDNAHNGYSFSETGLYITICRLKK